MPMRAENQAKYLAEVETTYFCSKKTSTPSTSTAPKPSIVSSLRNLHAAARDAYWRGVASSLEDGNQVVRDIYGDLVSTNQQIKTSSLACKTSALSSPSSNRPSASPAHWSPWRPPSDPAPLRCGRRGCVGGWRCVRSRARSGRRC